MPSLTTREIIRLGIPERSPLIKLCALRWGIVDSTVRSWRETRGKRNPLDGAARYIRFIHSGHNDIPGNPGNARLAANYFTELVDELDTEAGIRQAAMREGFCQSFKRKVTDSSEVVAHLVETASDGYTAEELRAALVKIAADRASLDTLEGCLRAQLAEIEQSGLSFQGVGAATARHSITGGLGSVSSRSPARAISGGRR